MSATHLPDGSVVMRPAGQRAVTPSGGGTQVTRTPMAKGAGRGASSAVRPNQPGRRAAARNAYS